MRIRDHALFEQAVVQRRLGQRLLELARLCPQSFHLRNWGQRQGRLDAWLHEYNESRPHQGRWGASATPDEDLPSRVTDDEGENDRSLINSRQQNPIARQAPTVRSSLG